jgi:multicomponent Na+:H+ antiporter subunit E
MRLVYHFIVRLLRIAAFVVYYFKELVFSSVYVAWDILTPKVRMRPGIVEVPVSLKKDLSIFAFANLISMTPGSLTLDIAPDKKKIYIHVLYLYDKHAFIKETKEGLEKRIKMIFEP